MGVSRSRWRTSSQHFHAGHVRHHQVEQDQIVACDLQLLQAFGGVGGQFDAVALDGQQRLQALADIGFVVDDEDLPLESARKLEERSVYAAVTGFPAVCRASQGSSRRKQCAAAAAAFEDFDRAAMLLNDTVCHRKPEAGAFARRLGGEERIVDAVQVLRRDAVPRVGDLDARAQSSRARCGLSDVAAARPWHRGHSGTG